MEESRRLCYAPGQTDAHVFRKPTKASRNSGINESKINCNQVTAMRNSAGIRPYSEKEKKKKKVWPEVNTWEGTVWLSSSHKLKLGNSCGSDCWCNSISWERERERERELLGNFWARERGRQCVKSRMCFHRECFLWIVLVLLRTCAASRERTSVSVRNKRKCLPLCVDTMESFISLCLSFYGSQTAEQLKLCTSQKIRKELAPKMCHGRRR